MRAAAFIAALACAASACAGAHAQSGKESRYGPAPERAPTAVNGRAPGYTGSTYGGRALGWSGKREIVAPEAQAAAQAQPWWARSAPQTAPQAPPQPQRATYQPQAPGPTATPAPRTIYDIPPPAPAADTAPPQFRPGEVGVRNYSVGRQYGLAPDPIPAAGPTRMVLISAPPPAEDEDKPRDADSGGGEWAAKPEKDSGQ
jgi:hypothetical protein